MRTFVVLGLTALVAAGCKDAVGPDDATNLDRGLTADVVSTSTLSLLDALGAATPATQFSVFGSAGLAVLSTQFVGPQFTLTRRTTITEIGGFVNNCGSIVAGSPQCSGTRPFTVQIRPSKNGIPDAAIVLASFVLSDDNDPLVISYESAATHLTLDPGSYFALFAPQGSNAGVLLANATDPFDYQAGSITAGVLNPTTGSSAVDANRGAVRILGIAATPQGSVQLLISAVGSLVSKGELTWGQGKGLLRKLNAAIASLDRGRAKAGCNQLSAFANQVHGLVRARQLPAGAGQEMIDAVEGVRSQIDCE